MKRSEINNIYREAKNCFLSHGWALPPQPAWDITDFGLNDFANFGLVLINLAEEIEYCEKLMYARTGQTTPLHTHKQKKEDIICRHGRFALELWNGHPATATAGEAFEIQINNTIRTVANGVELELSAGERITLTPGIYHAFWPTTKDCIIGEVSTANDDANDNFFVDPNIGRFPEVEEDEAPIIQLLSDQ
ncbi:D-lyxose/D-mannose family sugar isomerase [Coraliomargarita sp. SDUM461004]|uniref:D-lyxose ketol-isomerase n=1 Tax=Thalassobacterium sedimentorum TaxID=3041258 RepID=A0ABU1AIH5_9BACT|nr:D-lyxose/D-mannose family sugar isomerase [Coraliomargarita sp. SDUM461004]MDQ8194549.1 D-lyxose/D-mannose family sugar isomerase [Coraliomargarita sp. SDUM461004]